MVLLNLGHHLMQVLIIRARAHALRQIWMPKGLPVEDGFLYAMILTDCFRSEIDQSKIMRAANATHYYETLTSLKAIFQHELRIVIGTAVNCYFTWDFLKFATDPNGPGAGVTIKHLAGNDPLWYSKLINNAIQNHGFWVLPKGMLFRRFANLGSYNGPALIKRAIIAIIGFTLDVPVFFVANSRLKGGKAIGYW
jgi:hypothetical protein